MSEKFLKSYHFFPRPIGTENQAKSWLKRCFGGSTAALKSFLLKNYTIEQKSCGNKWLKIAYTYVL